MAKIINPTSALNKSIKGIIFDCDGVLVDSEQYSCGALNVLFQKYFQLDIGIDYSQVIGTSLKDTLAHYINLFNLKNVDSALLEKFYTEKDEIYKRIAKGKLKCIEGIPQFLDHCLNYNISISVASSGTLEKIYFSLQETDLLKYFTTISSSDEVVYGKPSPDLFVLTAKKMDIHPENCLVLEDSISGIIAGNNAGMITVGITNTFSREKLAEANPSLIIDNVLDLIGIFSNVDD